MGAGCQDQICLSDLLNVCGCKYGGLETCTLLPLTVGMLQRDLLVVEGEENFQAEQLLESFRNKKVERFSAKNRNYTGQQSKRPQHRPT